MSSPWNHGLGLLTHFAAELRLRLTLSHSTVLPPCSLNLRDTVSPCLLAVTSGLWEVISLPFYLLRQAWIWTQVLISLMSDVPFPSLVPVPHWVPLCIQGPHPNSPGGQIPLWIKLSIGTCWDLLPAVWGTHPSDRGGDGSPCLHNPRQQAPKKCYGKLLAKIM
jgi:hypothetical protein